LLKRYFKIFLDRRINEDYFAVGLLSENLPPPKATATARAAFVV
jgi:hypothetical protein